MVEPRKLDSLRQFWSLHLIIKPRKFPLPQWISYRKKKLVLLNISKMLKQLEAVLEINPTKFPYKISALLTDIKAPLDVDVLALSSLVR